MKKYSKLFWIVTVVLVGSLLMIACSNEGPVNVYVGDEGEMNNQNAQTNTVVDTPTPTPVSPTPQETLSWDDLVKPSDSGSEPEDADPEVSTSTDSTSVTDTETDSETQKGGLMTGAVVDDSGEIFGELITGRPVGTMPNRH